MLFSGGSDSISFPVFEEFDEELFNFPKTKDIVCVQSNKWNFEAPNELHSERQRQLTKYIAEGRLDLFGKGFNEIDDKYGLVKNYAYSLCIENVEMPGYQTEKAIDAMLCGSVPIYRGPKEHTLQGLVTNSPDLSSTELEAMRLRIKEWLSCEENPHRNKNFAKKLISCILDQ